MGINVQTLRFVRFDQLMPIAERLGVIGQRAVERLSIWRSKADRPIIEHVDLDVALMHLPVVEAT